MTEKDFQAILRKIDRPPAGVNFVRHLGLTPQSTASKITAFARSRIGWSYQPAYAAIRDRIALQADIATLEKSVMRVGAPIGRQRNLELLKAFCNYDNGRKYSAQNTIEFDRSYFRIASDLLVPVSPLTVIRENGKFVPIFVCGWKSVDLTDTQMSFLWTMIDDAFLSLTDFQNSPAEFCFFPSQTVTVDEAVASRRTPMIVGRNDCARLGKAEMDELVETYLSGRELARNALLKSIDTFSEEPPTDPSPASSSGQSELFR
jgi:hypothetical protein